MRKRMLFCCLVSVAVSPLLHAGSVTPLHEGWQLQSACKLQAEGDTISTDAFKPEGWLKTAVPSTVLAAQAAAGVFPDPYYGMNLRQIPGTTYPIGAHLRQPAHGSGQPVPLRLVVSHGVCSAGSGGMRTSATGCISAASTIAAMCG